MYAVLQFYVTMKTELSPYQPMLKFFAVKAVVFLTFWGECLLVVLASVGVIKGNRYWSAHEIQVGISAVLSCFVMMIFGFLHVKSFTYLPYRGDSLDPKERKFNKTKMLPALGNVLDFRDVGRDLWTGTKQIGRLCAGKKVEKSFVVEEDHLGNALGRSRAPKKDEEPEGSDATKALMKEKTDVEQELERVKLGLKSDPDKAFVSEVSPGIGTGRSAATSPWQSTTTAFTPLFDFTRTTSPAPSSAIGVVPTSSLRSGPGEPISFGDARRFPKSSTGLLYPQPPSEEDQQSIQYPEKLEGDAGEVVYEKPTSWFRKVFHRGSKDGVSRHSHTPLPLTASSKNDAVIEEILEERSMSYDYPSAPLQHGLHQNGSGTSHTPEYVTTRTGRPNVYRPSPPRNGIRMPNALSPSRYPGFDEQAHVDKMYALHAAAMNVVSPPQMPLSENNGTLLSTQDSLPVASERPSCASNRVSALFVQPPQSVGRTFEGMGSSAVRLPRHDLPPASFSPILPPNLNSPSGTRRPLPTPPIIASSAPLHNQFSPVTTRQEAAGHHPEPAITARTVHNTQSRPHRDGPVHRLGLGLSVDNPPEPRPPSTFRSQQEPRQTQFVYDEY